MAAMICLAMLAGQSVADAQESSLLHNPRQLPMSHNQMHAPQRIRGQQSDTRGSVGATPQDNRNRGIRARMVAADGTVIPAQGYGSDQQQQMMPQQQYGGQQDAQGLGSQPLTIEQTSFLYQPVPTKKTFAINDIVTIRVDEVTRMMAEGEAENRKQTQFEAVLSDWVKLDNFRLRPDPQANGDPTVAADSNSRFRSEASVETRESMTFTIAARIVDIRPNGNLVLEANKSIRQNDNLWEKSLTGICRAQDVAADNVVLSRDLLDLGVDNQDRGHLRDGYKRNWFTRWWDRLQPF